MADRRVAAGLRALARRDADIARALAQCGMPPKRSRPPGFGSLLRAIVGQQISAAAAASLWRRLIEGVGGEGPESIAARSETDLRALGMSRQKAAYARGLALAVVEGRVDLDLVGRLDDEAAIAELVKIKGIGRWSAEVYLLFALGRADVWPAADLALAIAAQRLKGLRRRPDAKRLTRLAEAWRPWRGAAAHLLWHYYKAAPLGGETVIRQPGQQQRHAAPPRRAGKK